jgi:hypothetical protein
MTQMSANYKIRDVEALWPKINTTYKFDSTENRSVPCSALDDGAEYSMQFKMNEAQAKALYKEMSTAYKAKKQKNWPEKLQLPFSEEEGVYVGKAKLKGAYGTDPTRKPTHYDAKGNKLDNDFKLTTGSTVNILVSFYPWCMRGEGGVSLRLRAVQVVKYIPMEEPSPFDEVEGFDSNDTGLNEFDAIVVEKTDKVETVFEEKVEEPKKLSKKTEPKKPNSTQQSDAELSSIIDDWDD